MRNVLVTGGSRGLGLAVVELLAARGYRAIAVARSESGALKAASARASETGAGEVAFVAADLAQVDALGDLARRVRAEHGPLWGLVNNAGAGTAGVLANMRVADIEALVRLNTVSPLVLTRFVVGAMLARGEGRIVNIASVVADTGYSGLSVYAATKASLVGFTRSLAREAGRAGVTVNAVAPGFVLTDMTGAMGADDLARVAGRSALRRLAEPSDVAEMVAYLLSDAARNVTGAVMTVDAGGTA